MIIALATKSSKSLSIPRCEQTKIPIQLLSPSPAVRVWLGFWRPRTSHRSLNCETIILQWRPRDQLSFYERPYHRQADEYTIETRLQHLDQTLAVHHAHLPLHLAIQAIPQTRWGSVESLWRRLSVKSRSFFPQKRWRSLTHFRGCRSRL